MKTTGLLIAVASILTLAGSPVEANCITGNGKPAFRSSHREEPIKGDGGGVIVLASNEVRSSGDIVGLWGVTFYDGNGPAVYDRGFEQFHSDGTELTMDVAVPPAAGNICLGVWESAGPRKVVLHHVGWNWDFSVEPPAGMPAGTLAGTFVLDMTVTVSKDGRTFRGRYVTDSLDLDGNTLPQFHGEGVVHGTRIPVR